MTSAASLRDTLTSCGTIKGTAGSQPAGSTLWQCGRAAVEGQGVCCLGFDNVAVGGDQCFSGVTVFPSFEKNMVLVLGALHQGVQNGFIGCGHDRQKNTSNGVVLAESREGAQSFQNNPKFNLLLSKDQTV